MILALLPPLKAATRILARLGERRPYRWAQGLAIALSMTLFACSTTRVEAREVLSSQTSSKVILLGTAGGPVAKPLRSQPSTAVRVGNDVYLIDMGNGTLGQIARSDFSIVDVDAVFFTHHHLDHDADLGPFMAFDSIAGRTVPVDIVGPPGTLEVAKRALEGVRYQMEIFASEVDDLNMPELGEDFVIREVAPGIVYQDHNVTVSAVENSHYQHIASGSPADVRDKSYSYRFDLPDRSIVFTGDTGWSRELLALARGADVLVSEVMDPVRIRRYVERRAKAEGWTAAERQETLAHHLDGHLAPESVGRLATEAGVKLVVLTHYAPTPVETLDVETFVAGVRREFAGSIIAGQDFTEF